MNAAVVQQGQAEDGDEEMEDAGDAGDGAQVEGEGPGLRYWWLNSLDDNQWQEIVNRHGGFIDKDTGMRRTNREIPPGVRRAFVTRVQQAAQEGKDTGTGAVTKMYVAATFMSLCPFCFFLPY